jgi:hypothetical protein
MRERRFTRNYWSGLEPLGKTFWRVYVHAVFINFVFFIFWLGLVVVASHATFPLGIYSLAWLIVANPYFIYCWVSVWRTSVKSGGGLWSNLARVVVILHAALALIATGLFAQWLVRGQ